MDEKSARKGMRKGGPPSVSVIVPARNAAATLAEAIHSVQAQSFGDWEMLIVDDASDDSTRTIAQGCAAADPRLAVLHSDAPLGAAAARNRAILAAKGRYIAFLDADDLWMPEKLTRQLALMADRQAPLSYTAFVRRSPRGDEHVRDVPDSVDYQTLLKGNVIGCLTAIYDRSLTGTVLMPEIRRRHDFALWLDIVRRQGRAFGLNEPLAVHRMHRASLSANHILATLDTWRMYRANAGLSRWQAGRYLAAHLSQRILR